MDLYQFRKSIVFLFRVRVGKNETGVARTYLQTPLRLPEFFPIGQWNRFKQREVRHLTDPLALKLVHNGTKVFLTGP